MSPRQMYSAHSPGKRGVGLGIEVFAERLKPVRHLWIIERWGRESGTLVAENGGGSGARRRQDDTIVM